MKYNPTSRIAKFLPVLSLLIAADAFAATTTINFTNARVDRATVDVGTVGVSNSLDGTTNPGTITYSVSGLNLDDDGTDTDSLVVTLTLTGINGAPGIQNTGNGRVGVGGTSEIESNAAGGPEGIVYSISGIMANVSGLAPAPFFGDFGQLDLINFGAGEGIALTSTGGTVFASSDGATSIPIPTLGDTGFTFNATDAGTSVSKGSILATNFTVTNIPEPTSAMLLGSVGLLGLLRRRRNA